MSSDDEIKYLIRDSSDAMLKLQIVKPSSFELDDFDSDQYLIIGPPAEL